MNSYLKPLIIFCGLAVLLLSSPLIASDDIEFSLPDNVNLAFKPVYLGLDGNEVFTSKRVKLGSRQGEDVSYKERLSTTNLGGSFIGTNKQGKKDWLYYLGETEISRQQWSSVMRWWQKTNGFKVDPVDDSKLPVTGKTPAEIFTFIEALNLWVLKNTRQNLPKNGNALAYFRLPTEVEWAFAARGGIEVSEDVFDRPYPYTDDNGHMVLGGFEWFRSSSGKKVREVGSEHIKPNPLGLYDMIGNVEELTYGIFGHDFLFARYGGLVIRGGNFSTDQRDIRVSKRTEYDGYTASGEAIRLSKVGFRLALGTLVSETGHSNEELDDGYERYLNTAEGVTLPSAAGKTSLGQQATEDQINWYKDERERLFSENNELFGTNQQLQTRVEHLQGDLNIQIATISDIQNRLNEEQAKNEKLNSLINSKPSDSDLNIYLKEKDIEIEKLNSEVARLQGIIKQQLPKEVSLQESNKKILALQQKLDDAKRRDVNAGFEIDKNKKRIVVAEKRLLEALMRVAGYNLYVAWRNLKSIESKEKVLSADNPSLKRDQKEAKVAIKEYRRYIIQIVDNTEPEFFPSVKKEIADWLHDNKHSSKQIDSLDLLERHVSEVRKGVYLQPEYLYENLLEEPEMRK